MEKKSYKTLTKSNVKKTTHQGLTLTVTDTNVKMRPDDAAYQRSKELWQHVPRGCATIVVTDGKSNDEPLWQGSVMGFPKFGYEEDKMYQFPHQESDIDSFVFVTKENGECFHFTCSPKMPWGRVVAFGSKQVHAATVFTRDEDFFTTDWIQPLQANHYQEQRYGYAFQLITQMVKEAKTSELIQRKWTSMLDELSNCTCIAEACDPQRAEHLVRYDSPQLLWLGWRRGTDVSFLSSHPADQRARFKSWGWNVPFESVSVSAQDKDGVKSIQEHFRRVENCEGAVKYIVLTDGRTVAFIKDKNYNYVARRAVREKIKQGVTSRGLQRRIEDLHVPYTPEFLKYSLRFNAWVQLQRRMGALSSEDIDTHYMTIEEKFKRVDDGSQAALEEWERTGNDSKLILILGAPCQGCGKTRLGLTLTYILNQLGIHTVHVSQDDCKGQRKLFLHQVETHSKDARTQVIVIDKYNDESNRRDYQNLDGQKVFIGFHHPDDSETETRRVHLVNHCLNRIMERKNSHLSLRASDMSKEKLVSLLFSFSSKWKFPDENESYSARISLSVLDSTETQVEMVFKELQRSHLLSELDWSRHVSGGLDFHRKYEQTCALEKSISKSKFQPKVTLYWKIELDPEPLRELWKSIDLLTFNIADYWIHPSFHVTLAFFSKKIDEEVDKAWIPREGEEVKVVLDRVLYDDKCWAVGVKDDPAFHPNASHLHVTLARKVDVPPVYARQLFENPSVSSFPFSVPIVVSGIIQRVTK